MSDPLKAGMEVGFAIGKAVSELASSIEQHPVSWAAAQRFLQLRAVAPNVSAEVHAKQAVNELDVLIAAMNEEEKESY